MKQKQTQTKEIKQKSRNWIESILFVFLGLFSIQWIKMFFALLLMNNIGLEMIGNDLWLSMLNNYYLISICLVLVLGFLLINYRLKRND
jgi:membrane-anchored glycerophosphoryl diester phosphodiesterase (GDPDase)